MSMESAIKFYSEISKDESKLAQFADLKGQKIDEKVFNERILPVAKANGYDFSYQEIMQAVSAPQNLSDADLENVAGGGNVGNIISTVCSGNTIT